MPTLEFKGKQFIYSHHLSVPFRELKVDAGKSLPASGQKPSLDDNLIIHGDNLEALKALLPTHAGKIDCIFIDPPYNTGNEGWCYNDNVRSPLMKEWLKKSANPVDKEDLERHDKWLCMMWPRMNLLRELLAETGSLWLTLDENESHHARIIMDEVFGEDNFLAHLAWEKVYSPRMDASGFSKDFDSVLVYAKFAPNVDLGMQVNQQNIRQFTYVERETGKKARLRSLRKEGSHSLRTERPNTWYSIEAPDGSKILPIKPDGTEGTWRWEQDKFLYEKGKVPSKVLIERNAEGKWEVWVKQYYKGTVDQPISTILRNSDYGHTHEAAEEIKQIFGEKVFQTPKPSKLVAGIIDLLGNEDAVILDSFAGSGTTAHAVLEANRKDGGNRRFILVECEDYADALTAERVRRVINGYAYQGTQRTELYRDKITWSAFEKKHDKILDRVESIERLEGASYDNVKKEIKDGVLTVTGERRIEEKVPGLGGSFTFCTLGEPIAVESLLTGKGLPSFETLARYVFYTATGRSLETVAAPSADGFIGETELFRIHLFYQPDTTWLRSNEAALNAERVEAVAQGNTTGKRAIVFAVAKFMSQKELTGRRIEFCQLPYAVHRILGE